MKNRLRELLRKGAPTLGTRFVIPWPGVVEIIGETGLYDYVEFLAEGGAHTPHDLEGFARAAELKGLSTMIKVGQGARAFLAEQALAAGIQNVLFAGVRRPEDVVEAVKAVRAEPKGGNGIKVSRQIGYTGHTLSLIHI